MIILISKKIKTIRIKKFFKILSVSLFFVSSAVFISGAVILNNLPDYYLVTKTEQETSETIYPVIKTRLINNDEFLETNALNKDFDNKCDYKMELRLLNAIPIKEIDAKMVDEVQVIPCGNPFGVKIFTKGAVIVGISDVNADDGNVNPAKIAGLKKGDVILKANDIDIKNNEDILKITESSAGEKVKLDCVRGTNQFTTEIQPIKSQSENVYKLGLWVRDSSAGIGTMTFFNPDDNTFAGLGHGICDIDTGDILPVSHGDIVRASVNGVVKAVRGVPGELKGFFIDGEPIGDLSKNTPVGVFGKVFKPFVEKEKITIAMKHHVKKGKVQILTTISGTTPAFYDAEIKSINYNRSQPSKNMIVEITDPNLLDQTGGIIQGMSGSPIIQDGKLIGAITHVFVNDPTKGYGIFIENMLNAVK